MNQAVRNHSGFNAGCNGVPHFAHITADFGEGIWQLEQKIAIADNEIMLALPSFNSVKAHTSASILSGERNISGVQLIICSSNLTNSPTW
jgi:hypothetical protein